MNVSLLDRKTFEPQKLHTAAPVKFQRSGYMRFVSRKSENKLTGVYSVFEKRTPS